MVEEKKVAEFKKALINFAYEKGFVYGPSPEIYGGVSGFYEFGPVGKTLKNNVENSIRKLFNRFQFFEVECPIVSPKIVWEASGHLGGFSDPLSRCEKCGSVWRVDNLISEQFGIDADSMGLKDLQKYLESNKVVCPGCKTRLEGEIKEHNLMLKTKVGLDSEMYNRPETATTTYLPFLNYVRFFRDKLPFGVFQIGNAYRNEISPRQHLIRGREFTQAEAQLFLFEDQKRNFKKFDEVKGVSLPLFTANNQKKGEGLSKISIGDAMKKGILKNQAYAWTLAITYQLFREFGFSDEDIRYKQHLPEKLAFYAEDAWDLEINLNSFGWVECCGVHDRKDYDLRTHSSFSGKELVVINPTNNEKEFPHILEIAIGPNRVLLALLDKFYDKKASEDGKTKLGIPSKLSPINVAVFPLLRKPELQEVAKGIFEELSNNFLVVFDESGSIGKRYLRQDEIGTPLCVTVDFDSVNKGLVTLRERDSEKQISVKRDSLKDTVRDFFEGKEIFR